MQQHQNPTAENSKWLIAVTKKKHNCCLPKTVTVEDYSQLLMKRSIVFNVDICFLRSKRVIVSSSALAESSKKVFLIQRTVWKLIRTIEILQNTSA